MVTQLSFMLTKIRNAYLAKKKNCTIRYTKFNLAILQLLSQGGYIDTVELIDQKIEVKLSYGKNARGEIPMIYSIDMVSKPSWKKYYTVKELKKEVSQGVKEFIISTSQGLFFAQDCLKKNISGEVICRIL